MSPGFYVVYTFEVLKNKERDFIEAWTELTQLIHKHEGSYGSRLHHKEGQTYIAYAAWPSEEKWAAMGGNLPLNAKTVSADMKACCSSIKTAHTMTVVSDFLKEPKV